MVNVWRSFGASAERFPLAAADGRTVLKNDYVAVDLVYTDRTGKVCYNAHSNGQRWFYFSRMQPTDGLRAGEIVRLRAGEIDSAQMIIRIVQSKGRKDRHVMLP